MAPRVGLQYPHVRAGTHCVACGGDYKDVGLLLHWRCHDELKRKHDGGYGAYVDAKLDSREQLLASGRGPDEEDAAGNEEGA